MGIMANGGTHNGKSYISLNTTKLLSEILVEGQDQVMDTVAPYGRGTYPFLNQLVMYIFTIISLDGRNQIVHIRTKYNKLHSQDQKSLMRFNIHNVT